MSRQLEFTITRRRPPMLMLTMPKSFKVGDTVPCRINAQPTTVRWLDADHLELGGDDTRRIVGVEDNGELVTFFCGDAEFPQVDEP